MDFETLATILIIALLGLIGTGYAIKKYQYYYISYLDWEELDKIFEDPTVTAYFQEWGPIERRAKTGNQVNCTEQAKDAFKKSIRNFTDLEKAVLDWSVRYLRQQMHYTHKDWKFIKIGDEIEFGYPFTLGEYIFIPTSKLNAAVKAIQSLKCIHYSQFDAAVGRAVHTLWQSTKWDPTLREQSSWRDHYLKTFVHMLAHERIHIHQRYNQSEYDKLFESIGFKAVPKTKIVLDQWTLEHRVTNPDGRRGTMWLTEINDEWYMPALILLNATSRPKYVLIRMVQTKEGNWSPIVYLGKVVYHDMYSVPEYIHRFYLKYGMYDPNEIVAYLAADLMMKHKIEGTVFNNKILEFVSKNKII